MGLDSAALIHLQDVLSNLYSNPEKAVVTEYASNALDSHVEAKQTRPFEIETPGPLNQCLTIKDYGVGLSEDEILTILSQYGASTKRNNNDVTGCLGLGFKVGFAYTSQFTVRSVKDGELVLAVISKNEEGVGTITIADRQPTEEGNGVTVMVPTKPQNQFKRWAEEFARFIPEGKMILNGKPTTPITKDAQEIAPGIFWCKNVYPEAEWSNRDYVVQGVVGYPVPDSLCKVENYSRDCFVATVHLGQLEFTPSREALKDSDLNTKTLGDIRKTIRENLVLKMEQNIKSATSKAEALKRYYSWSKNMRAMKKTPWVYGKDILPTKINYQHEYFGSTYGRSYITSGSSGIIALENIDNHIFVENTPQDHDLTSYEKQKIKAHAVANQNKELYVFSSEPVDFGGWVEDYKKVSWKEIKETKIIRTTSSGNRYSVPRTTKETYAVLDRYGSWSEEKDLNPDLNIYYMSGSDFVSTNSNARMRLFDYFQNTAQIVKVDKNKYDKFVVKHPTAMHVTKVLAAQYKRYVDSYDPLCALLYYSKEWGKLYPHKADVLDPEVVAMLDALHSAEVNKSKFYIDTLDNIHYQTVNFIREGIPLKRLPQFPYVHIQERYPLFNGYYPKDSLIYVNGKYTEKLEKKKDKVA